MMRDSRGDGSPGEAPGLAWGRGGHFLEKAAKNSTARGWR